MIIHVLDFLNVLDALDALDVLHVLHVLNVFDVFDVLVSFIDTTIEYEKRCQRAMTEIREDMPNADRNTGITVQDVIVDTMSTIMHERRDNLVPDLTRVLGSVHDEIRELLREIKMGRD